MAKEESPMSADSKTPARVFISYSSTNEDLVEWVAALGERLMADGVDVVRQGDS